MGRCRRRGVREGWAGPCCTRRRKPQSKRSRSCECSWLQAPRSTPRGPDAWSDWIRHFQCGDAGLASAAVLSADFPRRGSVCEHAAPLSAPCAQRPEWQQLCVQSLCHGPALELGRRGGVDSRAPAGPCRLRVGLCAGEVIADDFIYCGCSRTGGGCSGEPGCTARGLGTSCRVGSSAASDWSPRWPWPGLAVLLE